MCQWIVSITEGAVVSIDIPYATILLLLSFYCYITLVNMYQPFDSDNMPWNAMKCHDIHIGIDGMRMYEEVHGWSDQIRVWISIVPYLIHP